MSVQTCAPEICHSGSGGERVTPSSVCMQVGSEDSHRQEWEISVYPPYQIHCQKALSESCFIPDLVWTIDADVVCPVSVT